MLLLHNILEIFLSSKWNYGIQASKVLFFSPISLFLSLWFLPACLCPWVWCSTLCSPAGLHQPTHLHLIVTPHQIFPSACETLTIKWVFFYSALFFFVFYLCCNPVHLSIKNVSQNLWSVFGMRQQLSVVRIRASLIKPSEQGKSHSSY